MGCKIIGFMNAINQLIQYKFGIVFTLLLLIFSHTHAQVGIGTTSPSPGALLDLKSRDKGLLVPRVKIIDLTTLAPLSGDTKGILVWNTSFDTGVGFHYWDGDNWIALANKNNSWSLTGNANTNYTNNFLGTTDEVPLRIGAYNTTALWISPYGNVAIGESSVIETSSKLSIQTFGWDTAINANTNWAPGIISHSDDSAAMFATSEYNSAIVGVSNYVASFGGHFMNTTSLGHGLAVQGNNANLRMLYGQGSGLTVSGSKIGAIHYGTITNSIGSIGSANNIVFLTNPVAGSGLVGNARDYGVFGYAYNQNISVGVYGMAYNGVQGIGNTTNGFGVYGSGKDGVIGHSSTTNGYGVFANGDLGASGIKTFVIDHPLDPENKYLKHANIESNEILNLYRGTATFNTNGKAIVNLPDYYHTINIEASYQLTAIGAAMPNLHIEQELEGNNFIIAGGIANKKVSWQVTAVRNDKYLQQNPKLKNMEISKGQNSGRYVNPELYKQPKTKGIYYKAEAKLETHKIEDVKSTSQVISKYKQLKTKKEN